jgi:hypothetical protein
MSNNLVPILVGISAVLFLVSVGAYFVIKSKVSGIERLPGFQIAVNELLSAYVSANLINWKDGRKFWSYFFAWTNKTHRLDLLDTMLPAQTVHKALLSISEEKKLDFTNTSAEIISRWLKLSRIVKNVRSFSYLFGGFCSGFLINLLLRAL